MQRVQTIDDKGVYENLWSKNKQHILQSWAWGQTRVGNWRVERISIGENCPVTVFYRSIPFLKKEFAYIPKLWGNWSSEEIVFALTEYFLKKDRSKRKLSHIVVEPNLFAGNPEMHIFSDAFFVSSKDYIQPKYSNIIDLSPSEEQLFANLKSKTRNEVRMSEKKGVIVKSYSEGIEPFDRFYEILKYIIAHTDYQMPGRQYFEKVWNELSSAGLAKIFIATNAEGQDLGAYFMSYDKKGAYHFYGGVNEIGRTYEAGYALKWATIKDAKAMGLEFYDHWGTAPSKNGEYDPADSLYHIARFKAGFGGKEVEFADPQILIIDKFVYNLYKVSLKGQKVIIKLKNLLKK